MIKKFKKGDLVKIINNEFNPELEIGQTLIVVGHIYEEKDMNGEEKLFYYCEYDDEMVEPIDQDHLELA